MALTLSEVETRIAELEAAKHARLLGKTRARISFEDGSVEIALPSLAEIEGELARLRVERSRLGGERSGVRPIRLGFGRRA